MNRKLVSSIQKNVYELNCYFIELESFNIFKIVTINLSMNFKR